MSEVETSKPYFCSIRAVLPAEKYWRRPTEEHVECETHHVAYSYREQQVIGEECFGDRIDSKRVGFIQQRYSCREKAYDEKREEVIAYQKSKSAGTFGSSMRMMLIRLKCAEFLAAFQRHFSFEILAVAADARDSSEFIARAKNHRGVFGFQITGYTRLITAAAMTDVVDVQIEMIAPEKWRERKGSRAPRILRAAV